MNIKISVEGIEGKGKQIDEYNQRVKYDIENIIRGAVEDQAWMYSQSRQDLQGSLGKYFDGVILEDLTERSWQLIAQPTDWYSVARLKEVNIIYDDGDRVIVEALISIEDMDAGNNEIGKGLFTMQKKQYGWRINYTSFSWNDHS